MHLGNSDVRDNKMDVQETSMDAGLRMDGITSLEL